MSHTNETANLKLPQFIASDKPTWLGDVNTAFSKIDQEVGTLNAGVEGATSAVNTANANANLAMETAQTAVTTANSANENALNAQQNVTQATTLATEALTVANNTATLAELINNKVDGIEIDSEKVSELDTKVGELDTKVGELDTKVGELELPDSVYAIPPLTTATEITRHSMTLEQTNSVQYSATYTTTEDCIATFEFNVSGYGYSGIQLVFDNTEVVLYRGTGNAVTGLISFFFKAGVKYRLEQYRTNNANNVTGMVIERRYT